MTNNQQNKASAATDYNKIINSFLWKFFGILFLVFVSANLLSSYKELTSSDELSQSWDESQQQAEQNLQRVREAVR